MGTKKDEREEFEFFGPLIGPVALVTGLPLVCYFLLFSCNQDACVLWDAQKFLTSPPGFPSNVPLFSLDACIGLCGWMMFITLLHLTLPGSWQPGITLANGNVLEYKLNGLQCLIITLAACALNAFTKDAKTLSWVYDNFLPLLTASILFSMALSLYLYVSSFRENRLLAHGGNTGWKLYDFFMGRELNPRIGSLDLKEFCELYPGLIGWVVIDLAMAYKQHERYGYVSLSMLLVCLFHLIYVADALFFEKCVLSTMDITTEGFGFMLAFGDLTWVPFTYSLQARYLVDYPTALSWPAAATIFALHMIGYAIFRGANRQKDIFRANPADPRVAHLQTLKTERGRMLIVSGWWGMARHINYFGDWLMGLTWCLPCGFDSPIPYFYAVYFAALLIHRELRDEQACKKKYGNDWDKYCSLVKYKIIPYLY